MRLVTDTTIIIYVGFPSDFKSMKATSRIKL